MKRVLISAFAALLFCSGADARPRHWYSDPKWWAGEAVIVGAAVADGRSSCLGYSRGLVEGNPLDRGSHNCGHAVAILSVGAGIYTALHVTSYRMLQDDSSRGWRAASIVTVPVIACAFHCSIAVKNYEKLPPR